MRDRASDVVTARADVRRAADAVERESGSAAAFEIAERLLGEALSALDAAGYRVKSPRTALLRGRGELLAHMRALEATLNDAVVARQPAERGARIDEAGDQLEKLRAGIRSLLRTPGSAVLDDLLARVRSGAPRPVREAVDRIADQLPLADPDADDERRRAVEIAFRAALRWVPLVDRASGGGVIAEAVEHLGPSHASYLIGLFREEYAPALPMPTQKAVLEAADALAAAKELDRSSAATVQDVVEHAAAVLLCLLALHATEELLPALRETVNDLTGPVVRLTHRDLS